MFFFHRNVRKTNTEKELEMLRRSVRRVAEATGSPDVMKYIPHQDAARGWNLLCAMLGDWIKQQQR
jgi:hypothetical protein